jgi:hypothetical protein
MYDMRTTERCPRCQSPLIEYIWHEGAPQDTPTVRWECVLCGPVWSSVAEDPVAARDDGNGRPMITPRP